MKTGEQTMWTNFEDYFYILSACIRKFFVVPLLHWILFRHCSDSHCFYRYFLVSKTRCGGEYYKWKRSLHKYSHYGGAKNINKFVSQVWTGVWFTLHVYVGTWASKCHSVCCLSIRRCTSSEWFLSAWVSEGLDNFGAAGLQCSSSFKKLCHFLCGFPHVV